MLIRKQPMARLFFVGHSFFVFFSYTAGQFYKGEVEYSYLASHGLGVGVLAESLALSIIVFYRIRALEKMKAKQAELNVLATTDPLTGLFNRRQFNVAASQLMSYSAQSASIALIDIDHFKKINDTYGHGVGDEAIITLANALCLQCQKQDILARYGGDEFILFMPDTDLEKAHALAENIRKSVEKICIGANQADDIRFTISIGITEVDQTSPNLQNSIDQADKALYKAKDNGRNQTVS